MANKVENKAELLPLYEPEDLEQSLHLLPEQDQTGYIWLGYLY